MKNFDKKSFFIGFFSGIGATLLGLFLLVYILTVKAYKELEKNLKPPALPEKIPSLDKINFEWKIRNINGEEIKFEKFKGKPIFLNFWATWCRPCLIELPTIKNLMDSLHNNVNFVLVTNEDKKYVEILFKRKGYSLPVYFAKEEPQCFSHSAIPSTFIIDKSGNIVFKHTGAARWDDITVIRFLRKLSE